MSTAKPPTPAKLATHSNQTESDKTPDENPTDSDLQQRIRELEAELEAAKASDKEDTRTESDRNAQTFSRVGPTGIVNAEVPSHADNDQSSIVFTDSNSKTHGPMPLNEWADYSRNNGL